MVPCYFGVLLLRVIALLLRRRRFFGLVEHVETPSSSKLTVRVFPKEYGDGPKGHFDARCCPTSFVDVYQQRVVEQMVNGFVTMLRIENFNESDRMVVPKSCTGRHVLGDYLPIMG